MTRRVISLRDRPIADSERKGVLAGVTALLVGVTLLLLLTRPVAAPGRPAARHARTARAAAASSSSSSPSVSRSPAPGSGIAGRSDSAPSPLVIARVSRAFLRGYLAYIYGQAPASKITDATSQLSRSLQADSPRVSPAMRKRDPRVVSLSISTPGGSVGTVMVGALVSDDGGLVTYRIELVLQTRGERALVNTVKGDG